MKEFQTWQQTHACKEAKSESSQVCQRLEWSFISQHTSQLGQLATSPLLAQVCTENLVAGISLNDLMFSLLDLENLAFRTGYNCLLTHYLDSVSREVLYYSCFLHFFYCLLTSH